jgi:hypothetical protein
MAPTGAPPSKNIRVSRCSYGGARIASESSRNEAIRSRPTFVDKVVDIQLDSNCAPCDIFLPMSFNPRLGLYLENREAYGFWSIGRLRPGVTIARANADLGAISSELARQFPKTNSNIKFEVVPLSDRFHRLYDGTMWLLGGASLCMLGIVYASAAM